MTAVISCWLVDLFPHALLLHFWMTLTWWSWAKAKQTIQEIVKAYEAGLDFSSIKGLEYRDQGLTIQTPKRDLQHDLDKIPFPARDLFPNQKYIDHWRKSWGYSATTVMTTRGCPFSCEFCSNAVFGVSYRERSSENVLIEIEQALALGYDRIHFADDVFTLNKRRLIQICEEILARGMEFKWECLGRVDSIDKATIEAMKRAGCERIFFGIESGDESILASMNKKISLDQARRAVEAAREIGLKTGAFFILCYPGETNETVLKTIRFAAFRSIISHLPCRTHCLERNCQSESRAKWQAIGAARAARYQIIH